MSRDPVEQGRLWIAQAEEDLVDARLLAQHARYAATCFLCQQASEKALKGVLYAAGADAVLGHSVRQLCAEVVLLVPDVESRCAEWAALDQYYIPTRYPDALPGGIPAHAYTESQANAAITVAAEVIGFARERCGTA